MIILDDLEQGTPEWFAARAGIPTASAFAKIISSTGKASTQAKGYMNKLLAEHIAGPEEEGFKSEAMERGNILEEEARDWYCFTQEAEVKEVGIVYKDSDRMVSCSPDGLVFNGDGHIIRGLEIKCPMAHTQVQYLLDQRLPTAYVQQVQGSMWVTGLAEWDFVSYHPKMPRLHITVHRDEKFHAELDKLMAAFIKDMLVKRAKLEKL